MEKDCENTREWRLSIVDGTYSPVASEDDTIMQWNANSSEKSPCKRPYRRKTPEPKNIGQVVLENIMHPERSRIEPTITPGYGATTIDKNLSSGNYDCKHPSAFDNDYHSVYVSQYPKGISPLMLRKLLKYSSNDLGIKGIFMLLQSPILLVAIGVFSAFMGLWIDTIIMHVTNFHRELAKVGFVYFLLFSLGAAAFSAIIVHTFCPNAAGSGLPQMKVAISGNFDS